MEKLNQLKKEIEEKERLIEENEKKEKKHKEILDSIQESKSEIKKLKENVFKVEVENQIESVKEIKVNNLSEIKFPEINIPKTVIPEYPKEIQIKEPKWFSLKGIIEEVKNLKKIIIKSTDFNFDKFKKKQNAIAVKLVTEDGRNFYNAGGSGGSGSGTIDITSLAKESKQDDIITAIGNSATDVSSLATETTLKKIAGLEIPAHDYISISYTGTNLTGVVYKTGGVGGTTVATLTLGYDGSNNLTSVTKAL
jgi:hypothetical protein